MDMNGMLGVRRQPGQLRVDFHFAVADRFESHDPARLISLSGRKNRYQLDGVDNERSGLHFLVGGSFRPARLPRCQDRQTDGGKNSRKIALYLHASMLAILTTESKRYYVGAEVCPKELCEGLFQIRFDHRRSNSDAAPGYRLV